MIRPMIVCFSFLSCLSLAFSDAILVGRGKAIDVSLWDVLSDKIGDKVLVQDKAEVFVVTKSEETLYFGGTMNGKGCVWEKNLKSGQVTSVFLNDSALLYALCWLQDGTLVAAGTHPNLGGGVWRKAKGGEWGAFESVPKSTVISCLALGPGGLMFAGGVYRGKGKVWVCDQGVWTQGEYLNQAKEVNTLCVAKGIVYAGGQKENMAGGLWEFDGKAWNTGTDLKFSKAVYASTVSKEGAVFLAGAGSEQKSVWENGEGFWNAVSLEHCLSLYAIHRDGNGNVYAAGWNDQRTGSVWTQDAKKSWSAAASVPDCFVVRGIA